MKTRVRVLLKATCEVEMEVEHGEDESSTDLLPPERAYAVSLAERPDWTVERVEVVK